MHSLLKFCAGWFRLFQSIAPLQREDFTRSVLLHSCRRTNTSSKIGFWRLVWQEIPSDRCKFFLLNFKRWQWHCVIWQLSATVHCVWNWQWGLQWFWSLMILNHNFLLGCVLMVACMLIKLPVAWIKYKAQVWIELHIAVLDWTACCPERWGCFNLEVLQWFCIAASSTTALGLRVEAVSTASAELDDESFHSFRSAARS